MVERLQNPIKDYPWGSLSLIPDLIGAEASLRPIAEVWFGAHRRSSSILVRNGATLREAITADPKRLLGQATASRFGELPFLVKLIAVARPLSLQAHPDRNAAREGYDREQGLGLPLGARNRSYSDPNAKPELLVALGAFEAFAGFRPLSEVCDTLLAIGGAPLSALADRFGRESDPRVALRTLLTLPVSEKQTLVETLAAGLAPERAPSDAERTRWEQMQELHRAYPQDIGVLVTVLLDFVRLAPGEALYVAPGTLHAYLKGLGLEVMGNSDNVLRCALTSKHVDPEGLVQILDADGRNRIVRGQPARAMAPTAAAEPGDQEIAYPTETAEFAVSRLELGPSGIGPLTPTGPELIVNVAGTLGIASETGGSELGPGEGAFISAGESYHLTGKATAYRVRVGSADRL